MIPMDAIEFVLSGVNWIVVWIIACCVVGFAIGWVSSSMWQRWRVIKQYLDEGGPLG